MRKRIAVALVGLMLMMGMVAPAQAQTILKLPLGSASFAWDAGVADESHSPATKHVLTCNGVTVEVPMPTTQIPVKSVVPGPGTYECTIYAENDFSRQLEPDSAFPQFQAGHGPNKPGQIRVQVQ